MGSQATVGQLPGGFAQPLPGKVRGYLIGFLALACAVSIDLAFGPLVDTRSAFLLLLAAVMTAAWFGGLGPGLATTVLAASASASRVAPIGVSWIDAHAGDALRLGLFLFEGILISLLVARLRAPRREVDLAGTDEKSQCHERSRATG